VLTAEVEHLLGFSDAANGRARQAATPHYESEDADSEWFIGSTHHGEIAVTAEKVNECIDVVIGCDGVKDEVEAASVFGHLVSAAGEDDFVGAKAEGVIFFAGRSGEDDGVGSEGVSEFDAHVAEASKADNADLLALGDSPVMHRRVGGDARAEQRRGAGEVEVRRNVEHEMVFDDDAVGIAAVGNAAAVSVREVVGEGEVLAELLEASLAFGSRAIGIDHAADGSEVAGLELGYG
jgi:hypothetical protein